MKRIGYVGLSTPSFYDYGQQASKAPSDCSDSPNPVIEGAFGALLLYDELWFLCRSLCPENMRHLPYVKFLDECQLLPDIDPAWLPKPAEVFNAVALAHFRESSSAYATVKRDAGVYWDARADNHTHGLQVGAHRLGGNSWAVENVLYDLQVVERLPDAVELVTNSFSSRLFKSEASSGDHLKLVENLVLEGVPQHLSPLGPYHECVEEVRESDFLSYFRRWVVKDAFTSSDAEIDEIKMETEAKLAETQRKIFLQYLDPRGSYNSFAETVLGLGFDALVPGAAAAKDLVALKKSEKEKQGLRWQGFILEARQKVGR